MTNSPNSDNQANRRVWLLWLSRTGMAFGVILLVGVAAGAWWAWMFIQEQLAPLVERNLTQTLKRPVSLGRVESFSLNSLRFGRSELPATATDADRASTEAVEVQFNIIDLLLTRTLELDLTLISPDVYIEQDEQNRWIATQIGTQEGQGPITTKLDSVGLRNAKVVLVPNPKPGNKRIPVGINDLGGNAQFLDNNQRIRFDLAGKLVTGGNFNIAGEHLPPSQQTNIQLQGQNLLANELDRLLKLPLDLRAGRVDGNLNVRYNPNAPLFLTGTANLQDITAGIRQLPTPLTLVNGMLRFNGQIVALEKVSALFGQIPLEATGGLHTQKGYDIAAQIPSIPIANIVQTLNLKPPVPVNGQVKAGIKLTGPIQAPVLLGEFATTSPTLVDKLTFSSLGARFALAPTSNELAIANIDAKPAVGGQITGKGQIKLGQQGGLVFDLQAQNVPAEPIAQLYGTNIPAGIKIGNVTAKAQVFGPLNDIRTVARWQAPQATYAGSGEIIVARGQTVLRDATFNVPGGTVQAAAAIGGGKWELLVETPRLPVSSVLALTQTGTEGRGQGAGEQADIPLPIRQGVISGRAKLNGNQGSFALGDIQAIAEGNLQAAGGNIQLRRGALQSGRWQALVTTSGVQLSRFPQTPQQLQGATFNNGQFQLAGTVDSFALPDIQAIGKGTLNVAGGNLQILQAGLRNGNWEAIVSANSINLSRFAQIPPQVQSAFNGRFRLAGNLQSSDINNIKAIGEGNIQIAGGRVQIRQLQLNEGNLQALVNASGVQLGRFPQVPPQLRGSFSGDLKVAGNLDNLTAPEGQQPLSQIEAIARGNLQIAGGNIQIQQAQLTQGNWRALVGVSNVQIARFPQVPNQLQGSFTGRAVISGNLDTLTPQPNESPLNQIEAAAEGTLQIAGGNVRIQQAVLNQGNWEALIAASGVQLARLPQVPAQFRGTFNGRAKLAGNIATLTTPSKESPLSQIQAIAEGNLRFPSGNLQIRQAQLERGNWQANVVASNVQLGNFPQVPKQFQGAFSGQLLLAGNLDTFTATPNRSPLSQIQAAVREGNLQIAGGNIQIRQAELNKGNLQADVSLSQVQLDRFNQQLRGRISGDLQFAGNVNALTARGSSPLPDIKAAGQISLSQGVAAINGPLTASFQWNGTQLLIQQASAPGLNASGIVAANFNRNGTPNITAVDLNVNARDFNLQTLPIQLPNNINVAGRVDFNGRISGTPNAPNAAGDLQLRNFAIDGLAFDPVLRGNVQVTAAGGVRLDIAGTEDRIAVELDRNYSPVSFIVRRDGALAQGRKEGDLLLVNVESFPIATLTSLAQRLGQVPNQLANQPITGQLSGNFAVNLEQRTVSGSNVAIAQPTIGELKADLVSADSLSYANGITEINNARLQQGESVYNLNARITPTDFVARVQIDEGKIQNVLATLNLFNLRTGAASRGGFASARNLELVPVGIPNAPLISQLRRFSEIEALLAQQRTRREQASPIPDIAELKGDFRGTIAISGDLPNSTATLPNDLRVSFDFSGDNWQLGDYRAEKVVAQGSLENGALRFNPVQLQLNGASLAFSGIVGVQQQSGQLIVQNFPVELLNNFVALPVAVTGKLNGVADLKGTLENPEINGDLTLVQGTLNGTQVQSAKAEFTYDDARLTFNSQIAIQQNQPILIAGSVPYQLPFSSVQPDNNLISLDVNVQNEGLGLLNLLTRRQVQWKAGQGNAQLQVRGTLSEPQITGIAQVQNATLEAVALPEPLTDVRGTVRFEGDRIIVDNVAGKFSQGAVTAQGIIPISRALSQPAQNLANPLTVNLNQLGINLKGLYRGGVNGNLVVTGAALEPRISGVLQLSNGEIFLGERNPQVTTVSQTTAANQPTSGTLSSPVLELNDLQLILQDNVRVTRPPLFSFVANGNLTVNGLLNDLRPQGTIQLRRGEVNLFVTQFSLDRGYEQTATFTPEYGLDPILDVRLATTVPEVTGSRLPASPISSEIADVPTTGFFGSVETVRVVARVEGLASQLADSLELTSTPPRSESEIVALIGGGFVQNLGRGDSTLGLANLAGSALLSNQQVQGTITAIGQAIGLSELRLFPTAITSDRDGRTRGSTLGLAAEAVIDITDSLSASVSKVITTQQPFRYNLRYRVNPNILLRGSTDLSGDTRALIEYEKRF
ncbi:MAG TPA: translocation/assembly module TamB domain-containing protein [Leptolyngbyaceae cyanobacterium]